MIPSWPKRIDCGQTEKKLFKMAAKPASGSAESSSVFGQRLNALQVREVGSSAAAHIHQAWQLILKKQRRN